MKPAMQNIFMHNIFGNSNQRGFRLRCFLEAVSFAATLDLDAGYTEAQFVGGSSSLAQG